MAWLSCTPEKADAPRYAMYKPGSPYLELPRLDTYEAHLSDLWKEVGMVGQGAAGITSIPWTELAAWRESFYTDSSTEWIKTPSNRWVPLVTKHSLLLDNEIETIRFMSSEYVSEYYDKDPRRECPKEIDQAEVDSLVESTALGDALSRMFVDQED